MTTRLQEIKEREQKATKGPWYSMYGGEPDLIGSGESNKNLPIIAKTYRGVEGNGRNLDSDFIAHSREDIPWLLAELDRMRDGLERIESLDPDKDTGEGFNEWGEAKCFNLAQDIARSTLNPNQ